MESISGVGKSDESLRLRPAHLGLAGLGGPLPVRRPWSPIFGRGKGHGSKRQWHGRGFDRNGRPLDHGLVPANWDVQAGAAHDAVRERPVPVRQQFGFGRGLDALGQGERFHALPVETGKRVHPSRPAGPTVWHRLLGQQLRSELWGCHHEAGHVGRGRSLDLAPSVSGAELGRLWDQRFGNDLRGRCD